MLNFKKLLKSFKNGSHSTLLGQASLEYIILMAALIGLITVWLGGVIPNLRDNLEANFFNPTVNKIVSDDGGSSLPGPPEPPEPPPQQ